MALTKQEQGEMAALTRSIAEDLRDQVPEQVIITRLTSKGMQPAEAQRSIDLVRDAMTKAQNQAIRQQATEAAAYRLAQANKNITFGAFFFLGGVVATAATYMMAASGLTRGTYFIAWGAILFGLIRVLIGMSMKWEKPPHR